MDAKPQPGYAQAAIPEPYRILGLRLRPFSLGHWLLMQRFDCAFIGAEKAAPEASAGRNDLLLGVLICSMRHDEFLRFIEQKNFLRQIRKWGKRVGFIEMKEKAELFKQYLESSLHEPAYVELKPGGDGSGDWAQNLKITLMTRLGYSETEALDMPLSKALADYFKLAESDGILRLLTPQDLEMQKANDEALNKMMEATCPA